MGGGREGDGPRQRGDGDMVERSERHRTRGEEWGRWSEGKAGGGGGIGGVMACLQDDPLAEAGLEPLAGHVEGVLRPHQP